MHVETHWRRCQSVQGLIGTNASPSLEANFDGIPSLDRFDIELNLCSYEFLKDCEHVLYCVRYVWQSNCSVGHP